MRARYYVVILLVVLLQAYFLSAFSAGGILPNLVLATVLLLGRSLSVKNAILIGLWAGFWWDIITPGVFGIRSLWFAAWGAVVWWLGRLGVDLSKLSRVFLTVAAASFIYNLSLWSSSWIGTGQWIAPGQFLGSWVGSAILSGGFAALIAARTTTANVGHRSLYEAKI